MNDIRLASRGGVRLSDILPNYILKNQTEIGGTENQEITKPTCPSGARYKKALAIIPTSWNKKGLTVDVNDIAGKLNSTVSVDTLASNLKVSGTDVVKNGNSTVSVNHNIGASPNDKSTVENDTGLCVMVNGTQKATADENDTWTITLGTRDNSTCNYDSTARAIVQTYCYWAPSVYDNHGAECEAAGYFYDEGNSRCTETHAVDSTMSGSVVGAERSQAACEAAGYTWENNRCKIVLLDSDEIDVKAGMTIHQKAAACQAAGHKWTWTDADKNDGHCTN